MTTTAIATGRPHARVPCHQTREARIDLALHLIGLVAALIGCAVLLPKGVVSENPAYFFGVVLYAVGLVAMLVCSALYNGWTQAKCRNLLRRFDQAAIFLMIAGTYSPFMTSAIDDPVVAAVYVAVCAMSAIGLIALFYFPHLFDMVYPWVYVVLGWAILVAVGPLSERLPPTVIALIGIGGVFYSVGLIFHRRERPYDTAIWHAFVLIAAAFHFAAVLHTAPVA